MSDSLKKRLDARRGEIDAIDDELIALLERRAALAKQIGDEKRNAGEQTYLAPAREAEILRRVRERGDLLRPYLPLIYREILSACLACEKPASVSYLGPAGTYSHQAALKMFGHAAELSPASSIGEALRAAETERTDFSIVPFENSAAGTVGEATDALAETSLRIIGECFLRVRHKLLAPASLAGKSPADIAVVFGHPQALEQCRRWLKDNMPRAQKRAADSTAQAAANAVAEGDAAAIGSSLTQEIYQLAELASDIEDFGNNSTRFLTLGRRDVPPSGDDKTSFIMTTRDESGAMYHVLQPMTENGVSMTKLESRPARGRLWEYLFFVDIVGHQQDAPVARTLEGIRQRSASLKILGSYPRAAE